MKSNTKKATRKVTRVSLKRNTIKVLCDGVWCDSVLDLSVDHASSTKGLPSDWTGGYMKTSINECTGQIVAVYGGVGDDIYCPECREQADFFRNVCSYCSENPQDCELFKRLGRIPHGYLPSKKEIKAIEKGRCPFSTRFVETIINRQMSPRATRKSGKAVANAIREMIHDLREGFVGAE